MAAHLRECAKLDRELRAAAQTRTIFDPEVRRLRAALRDQCEAALLADHRLSLKHDVEQLLWKAVYYRPIEEFRRRIKASEGEMRDKTKLAFHMFLEEAKAFYLVLAVRMQQRWGNAGFPAALAAQQLQAMSRELPPQLPPAAQSGDCAASVHRCLVCLGDLCRYQANALPPAERDWAQCRHFYSLAARVHPAGGNAYNQLAVLASYESDDLAAAFFYIRALASAAPFSVARENLVTHFEQNRAACAKLAAAAAAAPGEPVPRGQRPASQATKELRMRCTRLLGTLLTREDLDGFAGQLAAATADLEDFLQRLRQQGRRAAEATAADEHVPPLLVQLVAAAIYAAHAASAPAASSAGQPPSFAAAVQQQRVRGLSLVLLFTLTAKLAAAAAAASEAAPGGLLGSASGMLLLPPLHVLLRWLGRAGPGVLLPPQQEQQEPADLAAARQQLWQAAAKLVGALRPLQPAAQPPPPAAAQRAATLQLPEDAQLAGFLPLEGRAPRASIPSGGSGAAGAQRWREVASSEAASPERVRRMLGDAAAIAAVLAHHGTSGQRLSPGLAAAQQVFVQAALPADEAAQLQAAGKRELEQQQQQLEQQLEQPMEEEEEEEEVILYAPPPRPTRSPPPPAAAAAAAAQPQAEAQARQVQQQTAQQVQQQQQVREPQTGQQPARNVAAAPQAAEAAAAPPAAAAAVPPGAAGLATMDVEMEEVLMAQTVEAVAGSVLPEDDRNASPPLPPSLAAAASMAAGQQQQHPAAAAAGLAAGAVAAAGGVQLPPSFFSLLGGTPQQPLAVQQQIVQQAPFAAPVASGTLAGAMQPPPQQAAGLRALLFSGAGTAQPPAPGVQQQQLQAQQAAPAAVQAPDRGGVFPAQPALLSSATPADRWAWMAAFGGGAPATAAASGAAAEQRQQQEVPLPIALAPHPPEWQAQQQRQQQQQHEA